MSWKMRWEIGWKINPIGQVSSSHYFTDTQEVMRWLEDMVDIFIYSILFHAATKLSSHRTKNEEVIGREEKYVSICEIRGRLFYARNFCEFCEFCGRIIKRVAWVWQGCHTLLSAFCGRIHTPWGGKKKHKEGMAECHALLR